MQKGWHPDEIEYTLDIINNAHHKKSSWIKIFDICLYWTVLIIALLGNFVLAVVLVPIFLVAHGFWLFFMVFLFAFSFGFLFTILLDHIAILSPRHHAFNWFILPLFSFLTVFIITYLVHYVDTLLQGAIGFSHYFGIAITYTLAFMIPYLLFLQREYDVHKLFSRES